MEKRTSPTRRRLTRDDRQRQLLDVAWTIIRNEGTEALTLGHLAEQAGVTKPVVYDHFVTRAGLLAALYRDYDIRQTALMEEALDKSEPTLKGKAEVIASAYVACVLKQGREIPGISAALAGSPELEKVKRDYETVFIEKCRANACALFRQRHDRVCRPLGHARRGRVALLCCRDRRYHRRSSRRRALPDHPVDGGP